MSNLKVALTGGIACGKSTVSQIFKKLGAVVIDLDDLAREVVEPGTQGLKELTKHFGKDILNADGSLNRGALRDILLKNESNQLLIEEILHPKILEKMQIEIEKVKNKLIIIEIPLLVEKNLTHLFDRAIIVDCNDEKQLKNVINREKIDEKQAKKLISSQIDRESRLKVADKLPADILKNNSEIFELEQKVQDLYQKLVNL